MEINTSNKISRINKQSIENLNVKCEWKDCQSELPKYKSYSHISEHVRDLEVGVDESEEEHYVCLWSSCNFTSKDSNEITRHVKYHAYLSGLKAFGGYVSDELKLPPCLITSEFHINNNVGDIPYICLWDNCNESSTGIQEFIDHIHYHVKCIYKNEKKKCLWTDCKSEFSSKVKLNDHVKIHTKEHYIACPNCGHTFANKTKFSDHCLSQKPLEEHTFQCDYCLSLHPTERILRKHMGQHIHHYKCTFCNMTCNKPSLLAKHIRNRHLGCKPFKCSSCVYQCKSKTDLKFHLMSHVTGLQSCQESGCNYTASSQLSLKRHFEQAHVSGKQYGPFACHLCEKKFTRGAYLTKHLSSEHNVNKSHGYSKCLYRLDVDGYRRLQTVRLESIDISDMSEYDDIPILHAKETKLEGDDPLPIEANRDYVQPKASVSSKEITVDVLGEKGQILSTCTVIPEDSLPPPEAEIIAVGS